MTATITDFNHFTGLRSAAGQDDPAALREVASQFEALFVQQMLKNMRDASLGDDILGSSDQQEMYLGMLDQQLALEMSSGQGIGLADMLVRQLGAADAHTTSRPGGELISSGVTRSRLSTVVEPAWANPREFASDIWPYAERAARTLDVAPEAIVAQAALETGWGARVMPNERGGSSLNLFGIKAGGAWHGPVVSKQTLEFDNGVPQPTVARFRVYDDVATAFDDYTRFLTDNPRYSTVAGHGSDATGFANALQASGYATDPQYAKKISRILQSPTLRALINDLKNSASAPITAQLSLRAN